MIAAYVVKFLKGFHFLTCTWKSTNQIGKCSTAQLITVEGVSQILINSFQKISLQCLCSYLFPLFVCIFSGPMNQKKTLGSMYVCITPLVSSNVKQKDVDLYLFGKYRISHGNRKIPLVTIIFLFLKRQVSNHTLLVILLSQKNMTEVVLSLEEFGLIKGNQKSLWLLF